MIADQETGSHRVQRCSDAFRELESVRIAIPAGRPLYVEGISFSASAQSNVFTASFDYTPSTNPEDPAYDPATLPADITVRATVYQTSLSIDSDNDGTIGAAVDGPDNAIVSPSPVIDWDFEVGIFVDGQNLTAPKWKVFGHKQDGFPAYEIYVRDSDGTNGDDRGTAMYQYNPLDLGRGPSDLFDDDWWFADDDVTIAVGEGRIE